MLRLNPEKGRPYINLHYYLPLAASILDLYNKGNLSFEKKKVQIINPDYDDPLLKEPIELISKGVKIHPIWRALVLLRASSGVFIDGEVYKIILNWVFYVMDLQNDLNYILIKRIFKRKLLMR